MSSIKEKLEGGASTLNPSTSQTTTQPGASPDSTLHNESSLNDTPTITKPASVLDLDAKTPEKYLDNLPT